MLIESRYENLHNIEYIKYELRNGRSIVRRYPVDELAARSLLKPIYESNEYKKEKFPVLDQSAQDIKYIEVGDRRTSKKPLILSDTKQIRSFSDIMKNDLTNAGYDQITSSDGEYAYIIIRDSSNHENWYSMRNTYKNMVNWLKDSGYYESTLLVPEDIDHVDIQLTRVTRLKNGNLHYFDIASQDGNAGTGISTVSKGTGNTILTDKASINELLDIYHPTLYNANSGIYMQLHFYTSTIAAESELKGYIYPGTSISSSLQQKLKKLGIEFGTTLK
jgi:ABC-2 type transport system permease protein